jgi:peptidyl-dipeptidase A
MIAPMRTPIFIAFAIAGLGMAACQGGGAEVSSADGARAFLAEANSTMLRLSNEANEAGWVQNTYITPDTEAMAARANAAYMTAVTRFAKDAVRYDGIELPANERRQMTVLKNALTMAAPADAKEAQQLAQLVAEMEGTYGRGKYCSDGEEGEACLDIEEITEILAKDRNAMRLREIWEGWHSIAPLMKHSYTRFVELSNKGARELGFADTGAMWRSKYDMPADAFSQELDRLWTQLRPLYLSLHGYVRAKLRERYGDQVPADGPIPVHLLGNLWAQDWSNVYDLVGPQRGARSVSLTDVLRGRKVTPVQMTRFGEGFFTSLGFEPLPPTFWERSLFVKPRDREVVCHASAWNINGTDDLRFKMCIDRTEEDFTTIHHELGHNFYSRAYAPQPPIFRDSANDGFHEAIGDTIALSVTPEYLAKIGLIDKASGESDDVGLLLRTALQRLAFLPFGLVVDAWRWQVFSGQVAPDRYNRAWWELRERYQGVSPPSPRSEDYFDPGAKYHIPANTPYARYFLASVLQFQFHRALTRTAGCTAPLHRCSIYGNPEAGRRLTAALELGASRPWPDALEALTGEREMDASAIADYYAPLKAWLDEQNKGRPTGW